ncbi:RDD family protein, partial [Mesorhizobium sp. M2E.F.Ca.ET.154.01.1.1]
MNTRVLDGEIITTRFEDTRAYRGVRTRRVFAFILDYFIVALLTIPFAILVALLGLLTFGLGWALFSILVPAVAILYVWNTLG